METRIRNIATALALCVAVSAQATPHHCYARQSPRIAAEVIATAHPRVVNHLTQSERLKIALVYLDSHKFITAKHYAKMTQLSKAMAEAELNTFAHDKHSGIVLVVSGKKKRYTKHPRN